MKAITCTQCGALIKQISLKNKFADCVYCGAHIILHDNKEKIVEVSDKQVNGEKDLTPWQQHQKNYQNVQARVNKYDSSYTYPQYEDNSHLVPIIVVFILVALIIIFAASSKNCLSRPMDVKIKTPYTKTNTYKTEYSAPTVYSTPLPTPMPTATPTPYPEINYEVKVQWLGANDMEHFEEPEIDNSKLTTFDEAKLKNTVFKNRKVQVRITIGITGEVTAADAISGHPILKEAAVKGAKESLFNPRKKPSKRLLTYYFRLISE